MTKIESWCCSCDYCINCGRDRVPVIYCDICNGTDKKMLNFENKDYCYQCLVKEFTDNYSKEIIENYFDFIKKDYDVGEIENE